jgi:hypothetical protein
VLLGGWHGCCKHVKVKRACGRLLLTTEAANGNHCWQQLERWRWRWCLRFLTLACRVPCGRVPHITLHTRWEQSHTRYQVRVDLRGGPVAWFRKGVTSNQNRVFLLQGAGSSWVGVGGCVMEMEVVAKISDFGLSRIMREGATHHSTHTMGTITHQAPGVSAFSGSCFLCSGPFLPGVEHRTPFGMCKHRLCVGGGGSWMG